MTAKRGVRKGVPSPPRRQKTLSHDFANRLREFRAELLGVTQQKFIGLLADYGGFRAKSDTTLSRLENGTAWPTLEIVDALARVDLRAEGGLGRGRCYWGWGELTDSTVRRDAPATVPVPFRRVRHETPKAVRRKG